MKIQDKILSIIFIFFLFTTQLKTQATEVRHVYLQYVDEVVKMYAGEIEKELGLKCCGGGGSMPFDVAEIDVSFVAYKRATIEEARELEVLATEKLLQVINSHKQLRPYLREYPFPHNKVNVSISFTKRNHSYYEDGSVNYLFHVKGHIHYFATSIIKKKADQFLVAKEPYKEALEKVMKNKTKI